jgi:hypothetical protein
LCLVHSGHSLSTPPSGASVTDVAISAAFPQTQLLVLSIKLLPVVGSWGSGGCVTRGNHAAGGCRGAVLAHPAEFHLEPREIPVPERAERATRASGWYTNANVRAELSDCEGWNTTHTEPSRSCRSAQSAADASPGTTYQAPCVQQLFRRVPLAGIEPVGFRVKSDLRNHQAIAQQRRTARKSCSCSLEGLVPLPRAELIIIINVALSHRRPKVRVPALLWPKK